MSISDRHSDTIHSFDGKYLLSACRMGLMGPQPSCAYCTTESTRACDARAVDPRYGRHGRCARPLCKQHTTQVGEHHDLCREHATSDYAATVRGGDVAQAVWWEIVETTAIPIPGTERPRDDSDRLAGVVDPDDGV
jgi:hypothetical protein